MTHDIIKTGDADANGGICDSNGDVVLALCRRCGRGEIELEQGCVDGLIKQAIVMNWGKDRMVVGEMFHDAKGRFLDGKTIHTSAIKKIEGNIVHTLNSVYRVEWMNKAIFAEAKV